ncbi:MAG: hypothetical protein GC160_22785 [Acidobacteria bacterium]|nr:hypothetical protein [Acidobacteriota bacterium]
MLRELIALFRSGSADQHIADELNRMIDESAELVRLAGDLCFQRSTEAPSLADIKQRDKVINKLQRRLRREAFGDLLGDPRRFGLPFTLSVMNVVKDVERIGDYAKELAEVAELAGSAPATRAPIDRLLPLVQQVERLLAAVGPTMKETDQLKAVHLIDRGKDIRRELAKVQKALVSEREPMLYAAADALITQYYIRVVSHALNVLSTLVTPLDRMDYLGKKDLLPEVKERLKQQSDPAAPKPTAELAD